MPLFPAFHRPGADEPAVILGLIDASRIRDPPQVLLTLVDSVPDGNRLLLQMGPRLT